MTISDVGNLNFGGFKFLAITSTSDLRSKGHHIPTCKFALTLRDRKKKILIFIYKNV